MQFAIQLKCSIQTVVSPQPSQTPLPIINTLAPAPGEISLLIFFCSQQKLSFCVSKAKVEGVKAIPSLSRDLNSYLQTAL